MRKKTFWIILSAGVLVILATLYAGEITPEENINHEPEDTNTTVNTDSDPVVEETDGTYSLSDLITDYEDGSMDLGTFLVTGTVIRQRYCPPCPEEALCVPCLPDGIIIAEDAVPQDSIGLLTDDPFAYDEGRTYQFVIRIGNQYDEPTILHVADEAHSDE